MNNINSSYIPVGIYDDLDKQVQPVVKADIVSRNAIAFGNHRSGKTMFLKNLLIQLHRRIDTERGREIYILDFGGNLGDYGELSLVSACFDNSNEENIRRVFKTIENKIDRNTKILKSDRFADAYFSGAEEKPVHMILMVDNVNSFLADERFTSYQEMLLKFCRDGLSKGLTVVFTAGDTAGGLGRYLNSFEQKFVFEASKEHYLELFGQKVSEPMKNAGRGVTVVDGKPREFQCFLPLPCENEKQELKDFIEEIKDIKVKTEKLQAFGQELTVDNFEQYCAESGFESEKAFSEPESVIVGLDYYEHLPVRINFNEARAIAIYGKKKFGKTNLLSHLISTIRKKYEKCRFVFLDDGRKQLLEFHDENDPESFYVSELAKFEQILVEKCNVAQKPGYPGAKPAPPPMRPGGAPGARPIGAGIGAAGQGVTGGTSPLPSAAPAAPAVKRPEPAAERETPFTVFVLQSKSLFQNNGKRIIKSYLSEMTANAEQNKWLFIYSDMKKIADNDKEVASSLNSGIAAAFLLDNIADFVLNRGRDSVFSEMDVNELKNEYARCEVGDGYYYDIESDELKKLKFIKA
ncbi:MAG: cell division protein FtsK [Ruminococcus sp.]|nr:cell division protein FtsK [Ruminococcus sp.]